MAILFNNMAGCYDRLRFNLTNITTQRLGMHPKIAQSHNKTLALMIHTVRTANGDSKNSFVANEEFGGSGQGSGGSPPLCHSQLVVMAEIMSFLSFSELFNSIKVEKRLENCAKRVMNKKPFSKYIIKSIILSPQNFGLRYID